MRMSGGVNRKDGVRNGHIGGTFRVTNIADKEQDSSIRGNNLFVKRALKRRGEEEHPIGECPKGHEHFKHMGNGRTRARHDVGILGKPTLLNGIKRGRNNK